MKHTLYLWFLIMSLGTEAQVVENPDFIFGNVHYFNVDLNEVILFNQNEIEVLAVVNHHLRIRVNSDSIWTRVARRSPAIRAGGLQLFVADSRPVKEIAPEKAVHGLLTRDVLVGIAQHNVPLIDRLSYSFPVGFTGGFVWRNNEDKGAFAYTSSTDDPLWTNTYGGIAIDVFSRRGEQLHPIVAMESCRVVWTESHPGSNGQTLSTICLQSDNQPNIYYIFDHLESAPLVRRNQRVVKGEQIAAARGVGEWSTLRLAVVYRTEPPVYSNRFTNQLNIYPHLLELYYGQQPGFITHFTKGQIFFGRGNQRTGTSANVSAYENHLGLGWLLGDWNITDRVEWINLRRGSNARLRRVLFPGEPGESHSPTNYFDYQISVRNGVYRVRALVGDYQEPSWQRIEFEGVAGGTFTRNAGDLIWTSERVVRVTDGTLTVRIFVDEIRPAGIAEIVFQEAVL